MENIYKNLYQKGLLIGDNSESSISLKGVKILALHYGGLNDFSKIEIIDENIIGNEFVKFDNLTKDYICEYDFVKEKIKEEDYDSSEEDELFTKLKSFNDKYKQYIGSSKLDDELSSNYDLLLSLLEFCKRKDKIIKDLALKNVFRIEKLKKLNYFIWIGLENKHYSLIVNIKENYYFLDSCGPIFDRFPPDKIISKNNKNFLYNNKKTFVMMSKLQSDNFNCISFCFAFVDIINNLYIQKKEDGLIDYLSNIFNFSQEMFMTEYCTLGGNYNEIRSYIIPKDFLVLVQSKSKIKKLKKIVEQFKEPDDEYILIINKIIENEDKINKIDEYRNIHLKCLMNSINNDLI